MRKSHPGGVRDTLGVAAARTDRARPAGRTELVIVGVVEVVAVLAYTSRDASFHWFVHFFVGAAAALLLTAVATLLLRRPLRHIGAAVLCGHAIAAFPDVLFLLGVAHARWMDVFLGHIWSHHIPGGLWTLYAGFLTALAGYLLALTACRYTKAVGSAPAHPELEAHPPTRSSQSASPDH